MRALISDYPDLNLSRFREVLTIPDRVGIVGSVTYTSETPEVRLSGLKADDVVQEKKNTNKNVIFFHFGFFTIRMVPRKGHTRLLRFFL